MKSFNISFIIILVILSACSFAAPSLPTATVQAPPIVPPSQDVSPTALLLLLPTGTATQNPVIVTDTFQPSNSPPPPTATSGMVMEIVSDAPQPTAQAQACERPPSWAAYTVQRGDTLSSLAQRTGTSTQRIQTANCLVGTLIFAGQPLFLPFIPQPPVVPNPSNAGSISPTPKPSGPGNPTVTITPKLGPPGAIFKLSITNFLPNENVSVVIENAESGDRVVTLVITTNQDGAGEVSVSLQDEETGNYNVYANSLTKQALGSFTIAGTSTSTSTTTP